MAPPVGGSSISRRSVGSARSSACERDYGKKSSVVRRKAVSLGERTVHTVRSVDSDQRVAAVRVPVDRPTAENRFGAPLGLAQERRGKRPGGDPGRLIGVGQENVFADALPDWAGSERQGGVAGPGRRDEGGNLNPANGAAPVVPTQAAGVPGIFEVEDEGRPLAAVRGFDRPVDFDT